MKKILSLSLVFVLVLSAFVLSSCKGTDKDAQNTAPRRQTQIRDPIP